MSRLFTPEMDEQIRTAWPEIPRFEGLFPAQIKARAYRLGLRLPAGEVRARRRQGFVQHLGKSARWRRHNFARAKADP